MNGESAQKMKLDIRVKRIFLRTSTPNFISLVKTVQDITRPYGHVFFLISYIVHKNIRLFGS